MEHLIDEHIGALVFIAFFLMLGALWIYSKFRESLSKKVDTCEDCGAIGPKRCPVGHCLVCPKNVCGSGHCIECSFALCPEGHCLKCVGTVTEGGRPECFACHQTAPQRRQFGHG
ncbi:MAG: hypothetical protein PHI63_01580 [Patescibacteria group bacterium]|nr:hypothetical protein [Patescibacteria group bacterium]